MRLLVPALLVMALPVSCKSVTDSTPILLTANIADPMDLNAVSDFYSCAGHAYPLPTSPNSGKNYFWPNSTNFSTNNVLKLFAACDGTTGQNGDDTNDPKEYIQGQSIHLWCDGGGTFIRYFHVNYAPGSFGHVTAGQFIGYASLLADGAPPADKWQESMNFDISVGENGNDSNSEDYFAKLSPAALAAWEARGVTSVSQTIAPNTPCASYSSNIGDPWIFVFTPSR